MMEGRFGVSVCMKIAKYKVLYVCIDKYIYIYTYMYKALTNHWTVLSIIQAHKTRLAQEFGTLFFLHEHAHSSPESTRQNAGLLTEFYSQQGNLSQSLAL